MPSYDLTVTLTMDGAAQYLEAGSSSEAQGDIEEAMRWYESAALNAPNLAEPQFRLGNLFFKQDKAAEAEAAFRRAIALRPDYIDAYLNLGAALHRQDKLSDAIACYERALSFQPIQPDLQYNLGVALYQSGDFAGAVERFKRALEQGPVDVSTHFQLGLALHALGNFAEAVDHCEQAVAIDAGFAPAHMALGNFLAERGEVTASIARYQRALMLDPSLAAAYLGLGKALAKRQDLAGSARCFERAATLNPRDPVAHYYLGLALVKAGNQPEAVAWFERALNLNPEFALAHCALGCIERDRCEFRKALARFERAIALDPNLAEAHFELAVSLELQGQFARASSRFKRAIALDPRQAEPHAAFGTSLLRQGEFESGWHEYEWRLMLETPTFQPPADIPRWRGEPLNGERILLCAEQGFGDAIQFVRYAPLVAAMGGRVVVETRDELRRLVSTIPGIEAAGRRDERSDIKWHCPLMSLPLVLGTKVDTIPSTVPYLYPDENQAVAWAKRLSGDDFRVGLSWAGNPAHKGDRERSLDVSALEQLFAVPGVRFFSLQRGPGGFAGAADSSGLPLIDLAPELVDFADTAAAMAALDLVITVDTSVAHLAGALGKPVWILLPHVPDWRWLLERPDSPWYPTAKLFRQPKPGVWGEVLEQVVRELNRRSSAARKGPIGDLQN